MAAPVLGVRPPGSLHPDTTCDGNRVGCATNLFQETIVRIRHYGCRRSRHRFHGLDGLEPSYVHRGFGPGGKLRLHIHHHDDRRADGHQGVQLAGDNLGRVPQL